MSKNILVISASLRNGSNSDMLADEFMRGALESGNKAEKITLRGKNINFCKGCLACQKTGKCVINDDMAEILPKMQQAERRYGRNFAQNAAGRCYLFCFACVFL